MHITETAFWAQQLENGIQLNDVQRQAVLKSGGAMLLLASPGSGKTTTLIMKIGYLIAVQGLSSQRIKAVTFSRAAALEMQERFKRFFPALQPVDFSTIHSLAFGVVREYFRSKGLEYQLIEGGSELDKRHILREIFKQTVQEHITEDQMDELTTYISFVKNKLLPREKWLETACSVPKAAEILQQYEAFKHSAAVLMLDYDDLLLYANQALEADKALLGRYQERYDYVLTDESQDTSLVQHYIIEKLVRTHGNLCVVADDDQAIYSWRGADPGYLLDFSQVYPTAEILHLEQNYRSSQDIVKTANSFIQRNRSRYPKNMFTCNPPHAPVRILRLPDYKEQAAYLLEQIQAERTKEGTTGVLYRNNASSIILINHLERAGIAFYIKDEDKRFFSHWVVEDILNFMRLTYTDKRTDIFEKIFTKINGYITRQQLEAIKHLQNNKSVFDNLLEYAALQDYQVPLLEECKAMLQLMKGMAPLQAIGVIRQGLGYEKALDRMCERLGFRKEYLLGVINTLEEIAAGLDSMEQFAQRLKHLEQVVKAAKYNTDSGITLSTFHSAKGLEFDRVYMIDLLDGIIPAAYDREEEAAGRAGAMEEAVRLFYVGMTRAKTHLELLTYVKRDKEKVKESPFVAAVRDIITPPVLRPGQRKELSAVKAAAYNPKAIRDRQQLQIGAWVKHQIFGQGKILRLTSNDVVIAFRECEKILLLELCLSKGLLEPA